MRVRFFVGAGAGDIRNAAQLQRADVDSAFRAGADINTGLAASLSPSVFDVESELRLVVTEKAVRDGEAVEHLLIAV